ncbi:MAG: methylglutamate dehydrogenase [Thiobacillus sp.]|nr:methylglutamate dehydrogenase [Thiobacillus sp.]
MSEIAFENVSRTPRAGVKGPGAAAWLTDLGLPVPQAPNSWLPLSGGIIARLGLTEFLIEGPESAKLAAPLVHGVYPVLRQDTALVLRGDRLNDLLLETCSVDFRALDPAVRPVVLTSMAGVSVTVIPCTENGVPYTRLWCDNTYGEWFFETLTGIAGELMQLSQQRNQGATP